MDFSEALDKVSTALVNVGSQIDTDNYDGLIVKKLESSNTLDEGRTTNQTHIAITGNQMDLFPYVRADGYFEVQYDQEDVSLKKFFVAQIPVYLHKENAKYLDPSISIFPDEEHLVHVSIVRSRRKDAADQIQMSMTNIDSPDYVAYRKIVHAKSYMVLLKRKEKLLYDLYCIKEADGSSELQSLNNAFYKLNTNTAVKLDEIIVDSSKENESEKDDSVELPFDRSKDCARQLVDCIYGIDQFKRLSDVLKNNDKSIKIVTDNLGGNYLRYMFAKPSSELYQNTNGGKTRVFTDKDYDIAIDGSNESCKLSTEWVSSELADGAASANYLRALIQIINVKYSDVLRIYEEAGKWYLEYLEQEFRLSDLPDCFKTEFARRYITALLSKPFVILTGNSGTGKTRISKQFAEYLEVDFGNNEKNWELIPVGADWTDNTRILGYYNPLANDGKGKYEKTKILKLIERANDPANKNIPFFIILDEMNLSHVERYFADFLSHMETPDLKFVLDGYPGIVKYPENLFVVGTVNIDETTYMFSPKVLDRANVIEFKPDENSVLDLFVNPSDNENITPVSDGTAQAFENLAVQIRGGYSTLDENYFVEAQKVFKNIYEIVEKSGYDFAYRTVREIRQYLSASYELTEDKDSYELYTAIDEQLVQKILPKIHGNKKEIGNLLEELGALCADNDLPLSGDKIEKMKGKLAQIQYASFI